MTQRFKNLNLSWPDLGMLLLGVWLFLSTWVLGFGDLVAATWNALIFGALLTVFAIAALMQWRPWEEWIEMGAGAWLVISPWLLGFAELGASGPAYAATLNAILVGLGALALAGWSVWRHRDPGLGAH